MRWVKFDNVRTCEGGPRRAHAGLVRSSCRERGSRIAGAWAHLGSSLYAVFRDSGRR